MRNAQAQVKYRKDYKPSAYLIDSVDLCFDLLDGYTDVSSVLNIRPNPAAEAGQPLVLDGEHLELLEIGVDGKLLSSDEYELGDESLTLPERNKAFQLRTLVRTKPAENTRLEGLYQSNGMYCTQCEAEGFRSITYYLDRPDVMASFQTTIIGDVEKTPVMLSNGNAVKRWKVGERRHAISWRDPWLKPAYLFALVAGQLEKHADTFTTMSGREVALEIWVEPRNIDKCAHAMESLKKSMRWDEEAFGREYDLDVFMIVAVDDFNMGAMENKGLNVFNAKYILARPDTATDQDYFGIESVVAHEYFHNWTGNRVTCRDWFQLTLKEGLTVFRDQRFSADMNSAAVQRLQDVKMLRSHQFPEDAGPTAHPIRPESYIEMNNFYTATVYEKGSEVIRMYDTLLGRDGFRKGTDLYFERHDGEAVTCDDFLSAMADANDADLSQFQRWYSHLGTPTVTVTKQRKGNVLELTLKQSQPIIKDQQENPQPLHIPFAMGALAADGSDLAITLEGEDSQPAGTRVLDFTATEQTYKLIGLPEGAELSLLRNFSAPVKLAAEFSIEQNAFLLAHDSDEFARWEAGQRLALTVLGELVEQHNAGVKMEAGLPSLTALVAAIKQVLADKSLEPAYAAELLTLPSEEYLGQQQATVQIEANKAARRFVEDVLAKELQAGWHSAFDSNAESADGLPGAGQRRLKNVALRYLVLSGETEAIALCEAQANSANMTDVIAALATLIDIYADSAKAKLQAFYTHWKDDPQVLDKWFSLQALSSAPDAVEQVTKLLEHPDFNIRTPNRVRSLVGVFAMANLSQFHRADGAGYKFLSAQVQKIDALNPQLSSRLVVPLLRWKRYNQQRQEMMKAELQKLVAMDGVSKDLSEQVNKSL